MNRFLTSSIFILLVIVWPVVAPAATTVTTPFAGVTRYDVQNANVNGRSVNYQVIVLDLLQPEMSFYLTPSNGALPYDTTRQTTRNFAIANNTEVAINTHFFDTSLSPETDVTGIAASNGDVYSPFETVGGLTALNISSNNFAETVIGVSGGTTFASSTSVPYTTVNSSTLRRDGVTNNIGATDFRARTQIGQSRNGAQLMLFASSSGMTEQECAKILATQFGAFHVHGLDGGGSTTMVLRNGGSQDIIAIENPFIQRAVGANLGVQAGPYVAGIPDTMTWDADPSTAGIQQGGGTWNFSSPSWVTGDANRVWANSRSAVLGNGSGAVIALAGHIGVSNLTVTGGYTITGPRFTILNDVTVTDTVSIEAPLGESTSLNKKGPGTLRLATGSRLSLLRLEDGVVDLGGQTFTLIDPITPMTVTGGVVSNGSLVFTDSAPELAAPSGSTTLNVDFTAPKLTKTGAGAVTLGGGVTWSGALIVSNGVLALTPAATLPATAVTVVSGQLDLAGATGAASSLTLGDGATVATGTGTLTLGGNVTYDASKHGNGATLAGNIAVNAGRTFTVGNSTNAVADLTVTAVISGSGTLTKTGAGTLLLCGSNTVNAMIVTDGEVRSGDDNVLPDGPVSHRKGVINLAGYNETVGGLTMGGTEGALPVINTSGGLLALGNNFTFTTSAHGNGALITGRISLPATRIFTINDSTNAPVDTTITADIEGAGGLTKRGSGTLELGGSNTLSGVILVSAGTLRVSHPYAIGTTVIFTNTTVEVTSAVAAPGATWLGGTVTGNLQLAAGRLVSSNGTFSIFGDFTQTGGTSEVVVGTAPGTFHVTGTATVGGTLRVKLNGPAPTGSQTNVLLTAGSLLLNGVSVILPTAPAGTTYRVIPSSNQLLFATSPTTALEAWLSSKGLPVDTSITQDIEGDGWTILHEYVLAGDPWLPEVALTVPNWSTDRLQLKFNLNTNASDVLIEAQASSNLVDWAAILSKINGSAWTGPASFTQGPGNPAAMTINDIVTNSSPRFFRLRIWKP